MKNCHVAPVAFAVIALLSLEVTAIAGESNTEKYGPFGFSISSVITDVADQRITKMLERGYIVREANLQSLVLPGTVDKIRKQLIDDRSLRPNVPSALIFFKSDDQKVRDKFLRAERLDKAELSRGLALTVEITPVTGEITAYSLNGNTRFLVNNDVDLVATLEYMHDKVFTDAQPVYSYSSEGGPPEAVLKDIDWKTRAITKRDRNGDYSCMLSIKDSKETWRSIFRSTMTVSLSLGDKTVMLKLESSDEIKKNLMPQKAGEFLKSVRDGVGTGKTPDGL